MSADEFRRILAEGWPELKSETVDQVVRFYGLVVQENERQNLTRLNTPKDFWEGHVLDVRTLLSKGLVDYPALDLGSGAGVPGLLAALLKPTQPAGARWILAESEHHKAGFLSRTVEEMSLAPEVTVYSGRAERYLEKHRVGSVVARAVGPVDRIYSWLRPCSTWNNLVLFKGPGWDEEWKKFGEGRFGAELKVLETCSYRVGEEEKRRVIVRIGRVPRGTSGKSSE